MTQPKIQFRPGLLASLLAERAGALSVDQVAKRDLERYYLTLRLAERDEHHFTDDETALLTHVLREHEWGSAGWQTIWAEVADRLRLVERRGIDLTQQWDVDSRDLIRRLAELSAGGRAALADRVERYWLAAPKAQ